MSLAGAEAFLAAAGWAGAWAEPLAGDASGRQYWRLHRAGGGAVLMRAPADAALAAFVRLSALLRALELSAPAVLAEAPAEGLLLLEDFGDDVFARLLDAGRPPGPLLELGVAALIHLHRRFDAARPPAGLPRYDKALFRAQVGLFAEAALPGVVAERRLAEAAAGFDAAWGEALAAVGASPVSLLLRDYHAGNLVLLADRPGVAACGLLDFQDAGLGPRVYDLLSLVEDARRDYAPALRLRLRRHYLDAFPELDAQAFARDWAVLAAQRHFRVLGVFERLARARGRPEYLAHRPRLWRLIDGHLEAPALAAVADWLSRWLPPDARARLGAQ